MVCMPGPKARASWMAAIQTAQAREAEAGGMKKSTFVCYAHAEMLIKLLVFKVSSFCLQLISMPSFCASNWDDLPQ